MKKTLWRMVILALLLLLCMLLAGCEHTHEFGEWTVVTEPTCTQEGLRVRSCTVKDCQEQESEVLPALGHSEKLVEKDHPATCTEDGEHLWHCSRCGEVLKTKVLSASGHQPGQWETVTAQSCTQDGYLEQRCALCGELLDTQTLPATGHSGQWTVVREMTAAQTGLNQYVCPVCGYTEEEEIPIEISCSLTEGIRNGYLSAVVTMSTINYGEVRVTNLTNYTVNVSIPAGTYLLAGSSSNQNMLVTDTDWVWLDAGEAYTVDLDTACMNIHRNIPDSGDSYSVGFTDNQTLVNLVELFEQESPSYAVRQAAVWIVTDNASYYDCGTLVSGGVRYIDQEDYDAATALVAQARQM